MKAWKNKEQFMHGLNDEEMLVEIIRELTKCYGNNIIHIKNVLTWKKKKRPKEARQW